MLGVSAHTSFWRRLRTSSTKSSASREAKSPGFCPGLSTPNSTRTTYFVYEDGQWKHALGEEEIEIFMPRGVLSNALALKG